MKNKKKEVVIVVLAVIGILLITLGTSYAFFRYGKEGTMDNSVKMGSITFLYTEISGVGKGINITDAYPMSDELGKVQVGNGKVFDFKITSKTSSSVSIPYEITARKSSDSTLDEEAVKVYLTKVEEGIEQQLVLKNYSKLDLTEQVDSSRYTEKTLYSGKVPKNSPNYEQAFRLRMWIDDSIDYAKDSEGNITYPYNDKTFTLTVNVYANGKATEEDEPNKNIVKAYTYNQQIGASDYCVTGNESTCRETTCYENQSVGSCETGTIVDYLVNDSEIVRFHVMYDSEKDMTMQSQKHTISVVAWYANARDNTKGPLTALTALESFTAGWTNVENQTYTMGTTEFIGNAYTGCPSLSTICINNIYTLEQRTAKARMITVQEAAFVGCTEEENTCPIWMVNYMVDSTYGDSTVEDNSATVGYLTMSASTKEDSFVRDIWSHGAIGDTYSVNTTDEGIRAVVVVSK